MGLLRLLRRFPRVQLTTPIAMAFDGRAFLADATDISEGGIALIMQQDPPAEGSLLALSFRLPLVNASLEVKARIVHIMKADALFVGLQFVSLGDNERKALRRYINTRRFLFGDLRAPSSSPIVGQRMTERLRRLRHHVALM